MMHTRLFLALVALPLSSLCLQAATYFISPAGNDTTGTGTATLPWRTIGKAAAIVNPGDTVRILAGEYNERVTLARSGTADKPITWIGDREGDNWQTIIDPSTSISSGWVEATEVGPGVYKNSSFSEMADLITLDNARIASIRSYGDSVDPTWNTVKSWLRLPSDHIVTGLSTSLGTSAPKEVPWWNMVQVVFWRAASRNSEGAPPGPIYIRFRNGDNPNGKKLRVSSNAGDWNSTRYDHAALLLADTTHNIISNVWVRGAFTGAVIIDSDNNVLTHSRFSHSTYMLTITGSSSENLIQNSLFQLERYGPYNEYGAWTRGEEAKHSYRYLGYVRNKAAGSTGLRTFEGTAGPCAIQLTGSGRNNQVLRNSISNCMQGIKIYGMKSPRRVQLNSKIGWNKVRNTNLGLVHGPWQTGTEIFNNFFWDSNIDLRWHEWNAPDAEPKQRTYVYGNYFGNPGKTGTAMYWHTYTTPAPYHPTVYIYHNTFSGGDKGLSLSPSYADLRNVHILNNIFSTSRLWIDAQGAFWSSASSVGNFDYNLCYSDSKRFLPLSSPWFGVNNIQSPSYLWPDSDLTVALSGPTSQSSHEIPLAQEVGLDLSQPFVLKGQAHPALPGLEPGYFAGNAPNIGVFPYEDPREEDPREEEIVLFITSLEAREALLLDHHMSLHTINSNPESVGQLSVEQYLTSPYSEQGRAHFHPTLPAPGLYTVWCQVLASDTGSDSFYVSINGAAERVFKAPLRAPVWQWTRLVTLSLSDFQDARDQHFFQTSVNEISFRSRAPNTALARLLITNDPNFVPAQVAAARVAVQIRKTNYGQVLKWPSVPGTTYHVMHSKEFSTAPWDFVGDPIEASGSETEWLAPNSLPATGFFWIYAGR